MPSKTIDRAPKKATKPRTASPMNWKPACADDLIGQARRVATAQLAKAQRLARDPTGTMKLLLYGPPGVGKTSVVELIARELAGSPLAIEGLQRARSDRGLCARVDARALLRQLIRRVECEGRE